MTERSDERANELPGMAFPEGESDEHPVAPGTVRARAKLVARTDHTKRPPTFEKVAARSPGAPPPSDSGEMPRTAAPLPSVQALRDHSGSVLEPIKNRKGPGALRRLLDAIGGPTGAIALVLVAALAVGFVYALRAKPHPATPEKDAR